jgi:hypothetical protein
MSPGYEREKEANQDSAYVDLCPQQILPGQKRRRDSGRRNPEAIDPPWSWLPS